MKNLEFDSINDLVKEIKKQYPSLTDYQALDIACKTSLSANISSIAYQLEPSEEDPECRDNINLADNLLGILDKIRNNLDGM